MMPYHYKKHYRIRWALNFDIGPTIHRYKDIPIGLNDRGEARVKADLELHHIFCAARDLQMDEYYFDIGDPYIISSEKENKADIEYYNSGEY